MSERNYYWLKLMKGFFTQPKIKKLRKIAGGDTYTIIYLKLQLLSLDNDAVIKFEHIEDTLEDELALTIDEDVDNVSVTLNYMLSQGLIEKISENEYLLKETLKLIGSETSVAKRVRKYREKQKALLCNTDVTNCNTEIDIEKDKEKEKKKELHNAQSDTIACEPVITITLNDKSEYPIYQHMIDEWIELYPNVDVMQELRNMKGWCNANPKRRKTKQGILRFIVGWLSREQDKPKVNKKIPEWFNQTSDESVKDVDDAEIENMQRMLGGK